MPKKINIFKTSGFTLIETITALAILSIAVISMVTFFPMGYKSAISSSNKTMAIFLAQAKLEEIIGQTYEENIVGTTTEQSLSGLGNDFSAFKRIAVINYVDQNLNPSINDTWLKKVQVSVIWLDPLLKTNSTSTLSTLITPL